MGYSVRYYWFDDEGAVHRIPTAKFGRILQGSEPLMELAGRTVPIAEVVTEVQDREVLGVRGVNWMKERFGSDGHLDQEHLMKGVALKLASIAPLEPSRHSGNVRDVSHRIAKKRVETEFRFKPTSKQLQALRQAIWKH